MHPHLPPRRADTEKNKGAKVFTDFMKIDD